MRAVKFGSLFEFIRNGMNVKQDKSGDGLPITRIETISNSYIDLQRVGFAGLKEGDCSDWLLTPGDILFSHINSVEHIGKCAVYEGVPEKLVHGMNLLCLRPDSKQLTPNFAKYLIRSQDFRIKISSYINKAVNQASISIGNLKGIHVTVPELSKQRRIAAILDKADALRAKRREALEQLDRLAQSVFVEMFGDTASNPQGWPRKPLAELIAKDDSINYGVVQPGDDVDDGVPLVRVGDLIDGQVRHENLKRIAPEIERTYQRSRLKGDEILVSCVGSVGVVALASERERGFNIARAVARIRVGDEVVREFLATQLQTTAVQRYFTQELRTVSQPTLNIKQIAETQLICPPLSMQRLFADRLSAVRETRKRLVASSELTESMFHSLQHRAFRGEL